ncbi:MAG: LamG-like jellyroll fold domain-containing protein, partial [Planctomycetota bacterium]
DLAGDAYVFDATDANDGVRCFYDQSNAGKLTVEVRSGGGTVATLVGSAAVDGTTVVVALAWAANDFELYEDGASVDSHAAGAAPTAVNANLFIGQDSANANHGFCRLGHLVSYDRRSVAGEIEQLHRTYYKELMPWLT